MADITCPHSQQKKEKKAVQCKRVFLHRTVIEMLVRLVECFFRFPHDHLLRINSSEIRDATHVGGCIRVISNDQDSVIVARFRHAIF
jgi:hypothetical protein